MPPIRDHEMVYEDIEEDDGMPALVDNPNPSMTFTFFTDMTPITFSSSEPTSFDTFPDTTSIASSPPASPLYPDDSVIPPQGSTRTSHGKKRDASYIPRPPNAFILFRSSFIRSQQVPGKVEGNHSTLSKIIGMYWKTLSREEREQWEAKAVIAQAEHRKKYPDWRFRPGANAMAKLKVKDGPGTRRRKSSRSRKGKEEAVGDEKGNEKRCAKIADLLVEGKKGSDLEAAVKKWEGDHMSSKEKLASTKGSAEVADDVDVNDLESGETESVEGESESGQDGTEAGESRDVAKERENPILGETESLKGDTDELVKSRCKTPNMACDSRFKVPLTSMFRRSLSAPASQSRCPYPVISAPPSMSTHVRRDTVSFPMTSSLSHAQYGPFAAVQQREHEGETRVGHGNDNMGCVLSPLLLPPTFGDTSSTRWNDSFVNFCPDVQMPFPEPPSTGYDSTSPGPSLKELYSSQVPSGSHLLPQGDDHQGQTNTPSNLGMTYSTRKYDRPMYQSFQSHYTAQSSYSTLEGWAGGEASRGSSSRSRGEPIPFASTSHFAGPPEDWRDISTVNEGASSSTTNIRFDPTLRWYDFAEENYRPTAEARRPEQYSNDFGTNEGTGKRPNSDRLDNNYDFLFPDNLA